MDGSDKLIFTDEVLNNERNVLKYVEKQISKEQRK